MAQQHQQVQGVREPVSSTNITKRVKGRFTGQDADPAQLRKLKRAWSAKRTDADPSFSDPFRGGGLKTRTLYEGYGGSWSSSAYLRQVFLNLGGEEKLQRPFIQSPWVNACICKIAENVAKVPVVWRSGPEPDAPVVKEPAIGALMRRPNPMMAWRAARVLQTTYHMLSGEMFWFLLKRDNSGMLGPLPEPVGDGIDLPDEMWPVRGEVVDLVLDDVSFLPKTWKFAQGSKVVEFPAHSVFHPYVIDPYNIYRGLGPMQAAYRTAVQEYNAERFDDALLQSGGQPSGIYMTEASHLTTEQREEIKQSHIEQVSKPAGHRKPLVLFGGVKFEKHAFSPLDMEFKDKRLSNRTTIMAIFGVTKPVVGITDEVNRESAMVAKRVFWQETIAPYLDFEEEQWNEHLVHRIRGPEQNLWMRFDRSAIPELRQEIGEKLDRTVALVKDAHRSWNEAVEITQLDSPDVQGGDDRFIAGTMVPVEQAGAQARGVGDQARELLSEVRDTFEQALRKHAQNGAAATAVVEAHAELEDKVLDDGEPLHDAELTTEERAWLDGFDETARQLYLARHVKRLDEQAKPIAKQASPVLRRYVDEQSTRLRKLARNGGKGWALDGERMDDWADMLVNRTTEEVERQLDRLLRQGIDAWEAELAAAVSGPFDRVWDDAARVLAKEVGAAGFVSHTSEEALVFLRDKRIELAEGAMSTLAEDVKLTIMRALRDGGANTGTLAARLTQTLERWRSQLVVLAGNTPARAERIARTESTSIAGHARMVEMKRDKVKRHVWIDAGDGVVRDHHKLLNGRTRVVGKEFGYRLRYPGDSQAKPEEIVNCRCTTAPAPTN